MGKMLVTALSVLLSLSLEGCAGLGITSFGSVDTEYTNAPKGITTSTVALNELGLPTAYKCLANDMEMWRYTVDETKWSGMALWLIIPIPLALPTGHEHVDLYFKHGKFARADIHSYQDKWGCAAFVTMNAGDGSWNREDYCGGTDVFAWDWDRPRKYVIPTSKNEPSQIATGLLSFCSSSRQ